MEQFTNNASSTLNGTITSGAGSLIVTSATGFPTSPNFRIIVDQEIMLVTGVSGPNFTISRAQESTLAAAHTNGVAVTHVITAGGLAQTIRDHGDAFGTAANRPTAVGAGYTYYCSDMPVAYFDDPGTVAWKQLLVEYAPAPATAGSYTVVPSASISLTNFADAIRALQSAANSGNNNAALIASGSLGATAAWTVTLVASVNPVVATFPDFGVCVSNGTTSGTSVAYAMSLAGGSSGTPFDSVIYMHAVEVTLGTTTRNTNNNEQSPVNAWTNTQRQHLRLLNDGTALHFQWSNDGFNWQDWYSQASVSGLTNYGFYFGGGTGSNNYNQANIYSNSLTTPTQFTVTAATNASPSVMTIGTHSILPGDLVAIHGALGNTGINTTSTGNANAASAIVTAVTGTTVTTTLNGNGTYTASSATLTLLSR
jgi:hypothetical protein